MFCSVGYLEKFDVAEEFVAGDIVVFLMSIILLGILTQMQYLKRIPPLITRTLK